MLGIYLIVAKLNMATRLEVRSGRVFKLDSGFYGYVVSAMGGLGKRVARHLNAKNSRYWHVDYLLDRARVEKVICAETSDDKECSIARILAHSLIPIPGFGSSDCHCLSHPFFPDNETTLERRAISALKEHGLCPLSLPA